MIRCQPIPVPVATVTVCSGEREALISASSLWTTEMWISSVSVGDKVCVHVCVCV